MHFCNVKNQIFYKKMFMCPSNGLSCILDFALSIKMLGQTFIFFHVSFACLYILFIFAAIKQDRNLPGV